MPEEDLKMNVTDTKSLLPAILVPSEASGERGDEILARVLDKRVAFTSNCLSLAHEMAQK